MQKSRSPFLDSILLFFGPILAVETKKSVQGLKKITYLYEKSPIMSSYLVAWVIGEFDYVEDKTNRSILCRVYTPLRQKNKGLFALQVCIKCLEFYEKYVN